MDSQARKRPFTVIVNPINAVDDLLDDLIDKMVDQQISLRSLLSGLLDSTDSKVKSFANRFYKNDGPSVLVGIWAARLKNTQHFKTLCNSNSVSGEKSYPSIKVQVLYLY